MAIGIATGAHGGDEFLKLPSLYKIEVGPERRQLTGDTAGQLVAVAGAAILIRLVMLAPAPAPWTTRHIRRVDCDRANAQPIPAMMKSVQANTTTGLRPYRSDAGP